MKSRSLKHIVGDTFEDAKGNKVKGRLVSKEPFLFGKHASIVPWCSCAGSAIKRVIDEGWKRYSELYPEADSYTTSLDTGFGDNTFYCAVNFYKTKTIKKRR